MGVPGRDETGASAPRAKVCAQPGPQERLSPLQKRAVSKPRNQAYDRGVRVRRMRLVRRSTPWPKARNDPTRNTRNPRRRKNRPLPRLPSAASPASSTACANSASPSLLSGFTSPDRAAGRRWGWVCPSFSGARFSLSHQTRHPPAGAKRRSGGPQPSCRPVSPAPPDAGSAVTVG